jgi:hypothetical protein
MRYADSESIIFSRHMAHGSGSLVSWVHLLFPLYFYKISMVSVLQPMSVPNDIVGQVCLLWGHRFFGF